MRRVVVTGLGIVSPLGRGVEHNWKSLLAGKSGIRKIEDVDLKDIPVTIAGQVPWGTGENEFNPDTVMAPKDQKKNDKFILYGMAAGGDALEDAGWNPETVSEEEKYRAGVMMGSGIGGLQVIYDNSISFNEVGMKKISPFFIPSVLINLISGNLSIKYGLKGPNHSCVTACSTGTHAIGDAAVMIARGDADLMVAGGAESAVNVLGLAGFARMKAVTSDFNDTPEKASRPWDKNRSGFVMGEGAGVVVLEELEHAKKRNANILAEVVGYGATADAFHITSPAEDGSGAARAMENAMKEAGVAPAQVDYINAHGTSTHHNDLFETRAIKKAFGEHAYNIRINSTKSMVGHMLGAAGAVEFITCVKELEEGYIHPTVGFLEAEEEMDLNYVPDTEIRESFDYALSNSFGFGGHNASILIKKYR